jgi:tRNA threonylcarbamoyladenosine biosynthesis protein TsaE
LVSESIVLVNSEEETKKIARDYASGLTAGDAVILNGNLGSGKTFFIREACRYFDVSTVSSPTFALVNEYTGRLKIYHFDFYRINRIVELYDIGFEDYIMDTDAIIFIEWGNLFPEILPAKRKEIQIQTINDTKRTFEFRNYK